MPPLGKREKGSEPGRWWEVDFTEVRLGKCGYKYLLVFIDTFLGWVEAFPTTKETAQTDKETARGIGTWVWTVSSHRI